MRHYTSRAGDPHRHLHLQVNARVFAAGKWRGLDTVAFRDSIAAINGIGHAAVVCDPEFRAALAAHGYTLTGTGEIEQLAAFVGAFSKRAAQIGAPARPVRERSGGASIPAPSPGRGCAGRGTRGRGPRTARTRSSRARGDELRQRWLDELAGLGYRDRDKPIAARAPHWPARSTATPPPPRSCARLGAAPVGVERRRRARRGRTPARPRPASWPTRRCAVELAEDLTARAVALCVPLHDDAAPPEHIRALTSRHVLDVEADLVARLAARRGTGRVLGRAAVAPAAVEGLDAGQRGRGRRAGRRRADWSWWRARPVPARPPRSPRPGTRWPGRADRLVVVTPTLKAAQAADRRGRCARPGRRRGWPAQHGWRWDETGAWTRLQPGDLTRSPAGLRGRAGRAAAPG